MEKKYWILYFLATFFPLYIVPISGYSFTQFVNLTYITGFITASGIFLSLLAMAMISRNIALPEDLKFAVFFDLSLFWAVLMLFFVDAALLDDSNLFQLSLIMCSLAANTMTTILIINHLGQE